MTELVFLIGLYLVSAIPFDSLLFFFYDKLGQLTTDEDPKKDSAIHLPKYSFLTILSYAFTFAKGALPFMVLERLFLADWVSLAVIPVVILGHHFSFIVNRYEKAELGLLVLGLYTALFPPSFFFLPVLYLLLILLLNHFEMGFLGSIICMFVVFSQGLIDPALLIQNAIVFIVVLSLNLREFFRYLEGRRTSLIMSYEQRP